MQTTSHLETACLNVVSLSCGGGGGGGAGCPDAGRAPCPPCCVFGGGPWGPRSGTGATFSGKHDVLNTLSPHTMGEDHPAPSILYVHAIFLSVSLSSGRFCTVVSMLPSGPRN